MSHLQNTLRSHNVISIDFCCRTDPKSLGNLDAGKDLANSNLLSNPTGGRKPSSQALQKADGAPGDDARPAANPSSRIGPVRQSRIQDRPVKENEKESSLKIKIELDLEVEVDLYARVKGDVVIGLM